MAPCQYCFHRERDTIDAQYVAGVPLRTIIRQFGGSLGSASRHGHHVRDLVRARTPEESAEHGSQLLARVQEVVDEAKSIATAARAEKNLGTANSALNTILRSLELIGRLTGELAQPHAPGLHLTLARTVNVTNYGSDEELATLLAEALDNFNPVTIEHFRQIALRQKGLPACTDVAPPSESHLDSTT